MKETSFHDDVLPLKNRLFRLSLRITLSREEAEDIVQETLIRVWGCREKWHEIDSIEAFALSICRNLSIDAERKRQNRKIDNTAEIEDRRADTAPNPHEAMQQQDRLRLVNRAIDSLPERQRTCLQLRDIEGKTYKEIAQILQISEDQVKINIYRGRQTIKEQLLNIDRYGL